MAQSSEFGQMAIREDELPELDALARDACHFDVKGGPENKHGKVNILLQVSAKSCGANHLGFHRYFDLDVCLSCLS